MPELGFVRRLLRWESALVALLVLVAIVGPQLSGHFLTGSNIAFLALDVVEIGLMALPLTLIVATGEIDLSVESTLGLASAVLGVLWNHNLPLELILPLVLVVGAACGLFNGLLVTRFGLPSLAVTIGTLALYRGLAYIVLGNGVATGFPSSFTQLGMGKVPGTGLPEAVLLFLLLAVLFGVLLHATPLGRAIFAIGAGEEAAFFSGIRVKRIKTLLFVLSGVVSALAGIVYTFRFATARADNGEGLVLEVVVVVLLGGVSIFGGKGTLPGVVAAVFVLGAIRNALTLDNVSDEIQTIVAGLLLMIAVLAPSFAGRLRDALRRRRRTRAAVRTPGGVGESA